MRRAIWERIVRAALLCVGSSLLLITLSLLGLTEPALFAPAGFLLAATIGLGAAAMAPALAAARTPLVGYRVLYHAASTPNSEEAARLLGALARHCGHVSVIWRYRPAYKGSKAGDLSLYLVAPAEWERALESILPRLLPGLWAERVPPPAPPVPTATHRGVRCWRWDVSDTGSGTIRDPLASGIHIRELAAILEASDIEAQIHLWKGGVAGLLLAECDLRDALQDEVCSTPVLNSVKRGERGKWGKWGKWGPHATLESRLTRTLPLDVGARTEMSAVEPGRDRRKKKRGLRTLYAANQRAKGDQLTALNLRPLLGGYLTPLVTALASPVYRHYPLWEEWPATLSDGKRGRAKGSPVGVAGGGNLGSDLVGVPGVNAGAAGAVGAGEPGSVQSRVQRALLFPGTLGADSSLDSRSAGVVAPPLSYRLPHIPDRVLVLGRTTAEDRPIGERVVGVPMQRRVISALVTGTSHEVSRGAGGTGTNRDAAEPQAPGTKGACADNEESDHLSTGGSSRPLSPSRATMGLHDFAGEGLLVAGGTDAWRLDVAGSLARQGVDMGLPLIVIEGGPPPDEPPPMARRGARIEAAAQNGNTGRKADQWKGFGAVSTGDPFAPGVLGLDQGGHGGLGGQGGLGGLAEQGAQGAGTKKVAYIDLGNPGGSLHVNLLFVPPIHQAPSAAIGEVGALVLALRVALPAQMRFLDTVGVTGAGPGIGTGIEAGIEAGMGVGLGDLVLEAWLWVLLVRHHYSRLSYALKGVALAPEELSGWAQSSRDDAKRAGTSMPGSRATKMRPLLPCPDLPSLLLLMEQSDALLEALHRERALWDDPQWICALRKLGPIGEAALRAVSAIYERVKGLAERDEGDLFRLCAGMRDRLKRAIGQADMVRMLAGPPSSLHDLLDNGSLRLLRINLDGAYRAVRPPFSDAEGIRKRYGLYLLWAIWAFAEGRKVVARMDLANAYLPAPLSMPLSSTPHSPAKAGDRQPPARAAARPVMLLVHGGGAWFGTGSPLSSEAALRGLGTPESGVMLGVTVAGLRHTRSNGSDAYADFGTLVIGPLPVGYEDAPDVAMRQLAREGELHRIALEALARRIVGAWSFPRIEGSPADPARLLRVLRRLRDGDALVVASMPGGKQSLCTAATGSGVVAAIRAEWAQEASREIRERRESVEEIEGRGRVTII